MIVVSFKEFTPMPRYDSVPWHHVTIEESNSPDGPWTPIDTINLLPIDSDPANPVPRQFTTDNATIEQGWYRITFKDITNNFSLPVEPIHNVPDETFPYLPTVSEVGQLIMARTKDNLGAELGTFTGATRPTFNQVLEIVEDAADDVTSGIDTDIPEGAYRYVKRAIALRAAADVERSYFAEQINNNRSPYNVLNEEYDRLIGTPEEPGTLYKAIEREAQEEETGEAPLTNRPAYSFPDPDLRYRLGRPL